MVKNMGIGVVTLAILALVTGLSASFDAAARQQPAATPPASPTPLPCGRAATNGGWGAATASDVRVQLHEVAAFATGTPTPGATTSVALRVTITNQGQAALPYRLTDFVVIDCAGERTHAVTGGRAPAITSGELAAGASLTGWVSFRVMPGVQLAAFIYRIEAPGQTGAAVGFPLAALPRGAVTELIRALQAAPAATAAAPCTNAQGGNAIGGNAVGGNGGNGGTAVGGSAQGGNAVGGNGANGASAVGGSMTACSATPTP